MAAVGASDASVAQAARSELSDASRILVFDESGRVLFSSFTADANELKGLASLVTDRDEAIRRGLILQGTRYEVHRHHAPLVYGRTMGAVPETSEGAALCRVEKSVTGQPAYAVITYQMPNISARMVPLLQNFCMTSLQAAS